MNIIEPGFEILKHKDKNPMEFIEGIARVCYKSEDKIVKGSAEKMCKMLYDRGHHAMLEHFIFTVQVYYDDVKVLENMDYTRAKTNVLRHLTISVLDRCIISGSARSLKEAANNCVTETERMTLNRIIDAICIFYNCSTLFGRNNVPTYSSTNSIKVLEEYELSDVEQDIHGWMSVKFTVDRGVSHEIVRHRIASYAQESTRYCNYGNAKFGREITLILPFWFKWAASLKGHIDTNEFNEEQLAEFDQYCSWKCAMEASEQCYLGMLDSGSSAQEARSVLPNSTKTEIVMTAYDTEWDHFFKMRVENVAHPQMRQVTIPLLSETIKLKPGKFEHHIAAASL